MGSRLILVALAALALTPAWAGDAPVAVSPMPATAPVPSPTTRLSAAEAGGLPSMALDPQVPLSLYHGLYVGTEIFGVAGHGIKGGFGGDIYAGIDRRLDNGLLIGLQGASGYGPALLGPPGLKGFDFGEARASVSYDMGRFTPFMTASLLVLKPVTGPGLATNTTDSFNDLLNGSGSLYAAPRVGAGFSYALTGNTSVSLGVSVGRGVGAGFP